MPKFSIRFSKENWKMYYSTVVEAGDQQEAVLRARDKAESKGIKLPDEVWTRIKELKPNNTINPNDL